MKIKNLTTIIFATLSIAVNAQGITFEHDSWKDVKAKAKKENKMIFVDAYTTWCGPCKWMAKNVFTNDTVGKFFNASFISYKMDMEKGDGPAFAKTHDVRFYPTYLFFNSDAELVHRTGGSKVASDFIADGQSVVDPDKRLMTLQARFDKGESSPEFLRMYGDALIKAMLPAEKFMEVFLKKMPEEELIKQENFRMVTALSEFNTVGFDWVCKNQKKLSETHGDEVRGYLLNELETAASRAGRKKIPADFEKVKSYLKEINATDLETGSIEFSYYSRAGDVDKAIETGSRIVPQIDNSNQLNQMAWWLYENGNKDSQLEKAAEWAQKSVKLEENANNTDTYANILFKQHKYSEARTWAVKAIEIAKAKGDTAEETEALLKKIEGKSQK